MSEAAKERAAITALILVWSFFLFGLCVFVGCHGQRITFLEHDVKTLKEKCK